MKQANLKIKNYTANVSVIDYDLKRRLLHFLLITFGALAVIYVVILTNMVWNVVERRALINEAVLLSSKVGELELKYLSLSNSIDNTLSASMGFKEITINFATRKSLVHITPDESLNNIKLVKNEI